MALFVAHERWVAVAVLVGLVVSLTIARALSPSFDRRFLTILERIGHGVGTVLRWLLLGLATAVVFVPASLVQRLRPKQRLGMPRGHSGVGWVARSAMGPLGAARRGYGSEPGRMAGARRSFAVIAAVTIACLLIVDVLAGAALTGTGVLLPLDRGDVYALEQVRPDEGGAIPAWRDEPWAIDLMDDLIRFQTERYEFVPYVQNQTYAFRSRYLNTTEEERVSYQPPGALGTDPLRVAFFGGSVMFGLGQRDQHTIPSEFARIAAASGVPVEVHNYGFPRWVAWQEFQYLERVLAGGETFDLIVFLDGFNEFFMQAAYYSPDPVHHAAGAIDELIGEFREQRATEPGPLDGLRELAATYRRNSAVWRVADRLTGRQIPIPGSAGPVGTPEQQTSAALDIYGRTKRAVTSLAARNETPVRFFWQPQAAGWAPEVLARIPDDVTDLSAVFDGREQELYFDVVQTNEEGARILAASMWATLGPEVAAIAAAR